MRGVLKVLSQIHLPLQ